MKKPSEESTVLKKSESPHKNLSSHGGNRSNCTRMSGFCARHIHTKARHKPLSQLHLWQALVPWRDSDFFGTVCTVQYTICTVKKVLADLAVYVTDDAIVKLYVT